MRKTYTKNKTKKEKTVTMNSILPISDIQNYFKDENSIKATLASLADLNNNAGWKVIQAYLNEMKNGLINKLMTLEVPDMIQRDREFSRTQDRIKFINDLLTLPQFILDGYSEEFKSTNLDPYNIS